MKRLLLLGSFAALCLCLGLVLTCGGDDDDDNDDNAQPTDDDDDNDDCDMDNAMPSTECDGFCNADNCNLDSPVTACMPEEYASVDECIAECMAQCQQGCIPANAQDCFDAFTDCDTFFECMGITIE